MRASFMSKQLMSIGCGSMCKGGFTGIAAGCGVWLINAAAFNGFGYTS